MDMHLALALALLFAPGALGVAALRRWGAPLTPLEQLAYGAPLGVVVASGANLPPQQPRLAGPGFAYHYLASLTGALLVTLGTDAPGLRRTYGVAYVVPGPSERQQLGGQATAYRERYRSVVRSASYEVFAVGEERP